MPDPLRAPARLRRFALALCLVLVLPAAGFAAGDDLKLNLCKQVLSRMLCKKVSEFGYVGKLDEGVYVISVFYASKNSEMLCAVTSDGQVILQDRTWRAMRRVVPYEPDSEGRCLVANYSSPECPNKGLIKACPAKGPQDAKEQVKETFWVRPVPKILEEEYKAMSGREQQNATAPPPPAEGGEK
ncbi:MAG: hypothetical protein Q8O35_09675 [Humidesulfovibrio sp.]|uniref:hypothetical protein n=1 Tax=Humidesulfovibrio sp. TaxID=2910988 RepID=UPI002733FDAE|nr:hypothetical protein [Humidesulfovibrio sp.]MDP2848449.1 hypothetical protein [Humidesulfovibrio sp.]